METRNLELENKELRHFADIVYAEIDRPEKGNAQIYEAIKKLRECLGVQPFEKFSHNTPKDNTKKVATDFNPVRKDFTTEQLETKEGRLALYEHLLVCIDRHYPHQKESWGFCSLLKYAAPYIWENMEAFKATFPDLYGLRELGGVFCWEIGDWKARRRALVKCIEALKS